MRRAAAIACGLLLAFSSSSVFAQTQNTGASSAPAAAEQPTGSSVVNYESGLEALGQAPPANPGDAVPGVSNNLLLGLGLAGVAGLSVALIASSSNSSSSSPVSP